MMMNPLKIIKKYYNPKSEAYKILISHSEKVTEEALETARKVKHLHPDLKFVREAAMLHDIGICMVNEPRLYCYGKEAYIRHGVLGRKILEREGFRRHALVCERHVGIGITKGEIIKHKLPLPKRNMVPVSIEEKIICYADKFFSKKDFGKEMGIGDVRKGISKYGKSQAKRFEGMVKLFGA